MSAILIAQNPTGVPDFMKPPEGAIIRRLANTKSGPDDVAEQTATAAAGTFQNRK
jgi:hypothetical protein